MKYHIVLCGQKESLKKQAEELLYFAENNCSEMEAGKLIIYTDARAEKCEALNLKLFTETTVVELAWIHPETIVKHLATWIRDKDLYLFAGSYAGRELAVRAAVRRQGTSLLGARGVKRTNEGLKVRKLAYASYLEAEFLMKAGPFCVAITNGSGEKPLPETGSHKLLREILAVEAEYIRERSMRLKEEQNRLAQAELLFIAGRGVKSKAQVEEVRRLAELYHGEYGVSRPVAMNAWAPMERIIGISGHIVKPKLCILLGVSGAPALYAGIEKSEKIVAVNIDEHAPVLRKSDEALIADAKEVIGLLKNLREMK